MMIMAAILLFAAGETAFCEDWDSYVPDHIVGSGSADWWTAYPDQHENASGVVKHPGWVLDDLQNKPIMILVHSSNCVPCLAQMPRIQSAVDRFGEDLTYYDVLAEGSGYEKAIEILDVYDPDGGGMYVPTTIFITLATGPDGSVDVAWHSVADAMNQEEIDSYVKDGIYYYKKNSASWS